MSAATAKSASSVDDYVDLFGALAGFGTEFVVIGGCAVGAYARLLGERVLSGDLDLLVTCRSLESVVADATTIGLRVTKMPQPGTVPATVAEWRGNEVNLLTSSLGLPSPDVAARTAREFHLAGRPDFAVLIADPFDLLRNKLAVNSSKDRSHIQILRRFLDDEVVRGFTQETEPRARLCAAERLLEVLGSQTLDERLARHLVPLATTPADFRFLAHHVPAYIVRELRDRARSDESRRVVQRIALSRDRAR
jgi:hypothetical protein